MPSGFFIGRRLGLAVAVALVASGAGAQTFLKTVNSVGITNEDFGIMKAEAATLYEADPVELGAETIWSNPATGSHGTIEVTSYDGTCVTLRHVFRSGKQRQIHRFDSRRCKSDDGRWLLTAE